MGFGIDPPGEDEAAALRNASKANCAAAAEAILEADLLLLATGAGFSADSGLKTFTDIADVPAYRARGLIYYDLCVPDWLEDEPPLFYGFWGACFNDYRGAQPHVGYHIIRRWRNERFGAGNPVAAAVRAEMEAGGGVHAQADFYSSGLREGVGDGGGAFYFLTSNIDAHAYKAGFSPSEVREIHGNTELWQCRDPHDCARGGDDPWYWRAPPGLRFHVDEGSMTAAEDAPSAAPPYGRGGGAGAEEEGEEEGAGEGAGEEGEWVSAQREHPRHPRARLEEAFRGNHPACVYCGAPARPAVLMFQDSLWEDQEDQEARWNAWQEAVTRVAAARPELKVPSIRWATEAWARHLGGQATLVRVNPDFPLGEVGEEATIIPIMMRGREAVEAIDRAMKEAAARGGGGSREAGADAARLPLGGPAHTRAD